MSEASRSPAGKSIPGALLPLSRCGGDGETSRDLWSELKEARPMNGEWERRLPFALVTSRIAFQTL